MLALLAIAKSAYEKIDLLPSRSFFQHFFFGTMRRWETKRFISVHSYHHLKIIRDIREADSSTLSQSGNIIKTKKNSLSLRGFSQHLSKTDFPRFEFEN